MLFDYICPNVHRRFVNDPQHQAGTMEALEEYYLSMVGDDDTNGTLNVRDLDGDPESDDSEPLQLRHFRYPPRRSKSRRSPPKNTGNGGTGESYARSRNTRHESPTQVRRKQLYTPPPRTRTPSGNRRGTASYGPSTRHRARVYHEDHGNPSPTTNRSIRGLAGRVSALEVQASAVGPLKLVSHSISLQRSILPADLSSSSSDSDSEPSYERSNTWEGRRAARSTRGKSPSRQSRTSPATPRRAAKATVVGDSGHNGLTSPYAMMQLHTLYLAWQGITCNMMPQVPLG